MISMTYFFNLHMPTSLRVFQGLSGLAPISPNFPGFLLAAPLLANGDLYSSISWI
jgi:hypothetical protein